MKKGKIIVCGSVLAAFLMLSTMALNPVTAQEMINPPQEKDNQLTQLADLTNELTSSLNAYASAISSDDQIGSIIEQLKQNKEVQNLLEQIQNTDDDKERQLLVDQLIELLYSLPEFEQIEELIGSSEVATEINNMNEDIELLLSYIDLLSYETDFDMQSSISLTSYESSDSGSYLANGVFVIPTVNMIEYHSVFYPDEETDVPDPDNPDETLTYGELLDLLESGEITIEDLQDLVEYGDLAIDEYILLVGQYNGLQTGEDFDTNDFLTLLWLFDVIGCFVGMGIGIAYIIKGFPVLGGIYFIVFLLLLDLLAE